MPAWVQAGDIQVAGASALPRLINGYLYIAEPPHAAFTIRFPLPQQEIILHYKARRIRTHLKGDAIQQMENFGEDLTFFDPLT
jgi:hypothetical protein